MESPVRKRALLLLLASSTFFGIMAFSAKLATARLSGAQVAMLRFAISLTPLLWPPFTHKAFTFRRLDLLFYRGLFGGLAVLLYFITIERIPVGLATLLNYTAPIFSGFFAAMFIGEPLRGRLVVPLLIAFFGIVLVVRSHASPGEWLGFGTWEALGLLSAACSGIAVTAIRAARRTESSWSIYASFSLFGLLATAPFGVLNWKTPSAEEWLLLLIVGWTSVAAQLLMTYAYRWIDNLTAGVIAQFAVIVSVILGALWLDEPLTALSVVGSLLTIGGVVAVMISAGPPRRCGFDEAPEQ